MRCEDVRNELINALKYWLEEKKVDGFRVDAVKHLFESESLENELPRNPQKFQSIHDPRIVYDDLDHKYTANQLETYDLVFSWRQLCDQISKRTNSVRYRRKFFNPCHVFEKFYPIKFNFLSLLTILTDLTIKNFWNMLKNCPN